MADLCPFEVKPFAQSKVVRNPTNFSVNYVNQDYWSMRDRMIDLIRQNHSKDFNDFTESSLAFMLIEMWAFLADQLSFKIDQIANEVFIDTVTELQNAVRLAKLVGFRPTPALPAKAMFVATLNHPMPDDTPIQTPLLIGFPSPYGPGEHRMELYAADTNGNPLFGQDIIVPAGKLSTNAIVGLEGETHSHRYVGTGESWQMFTVTGRPVLWKSIRVVVDGILWQEVEFFTDSNPRKEYRVEYSHDYRATIIFGNNISGLIPAKGATVEITYRIGGGTLGNIVTGAVNQNVSLFIPGLGYMVTMNVRNYTKGEGGYDGDTIEDIRRKLPLYLRTQDRCVTGEDYKALVDNFSTPYNGIVGKSTAVLRNHGCAGNVIDIYLLARDGYHGLTKASDNLKQELSQELIRKKMFTDTVCLKDGDVVMVDIHIDVILDRLHRRVEGSIKEKIERRIWNFFSLNNWEYGQTLKESEIIKALADIKELSHVDVTFTTERSIEAGQGNTDYVPVKFHEIIRPDNIHINFSYKGPNE